MMVVQGEAGLLNGDRVINKRGVSVKGRVPGVFLWSPGIQDQGPHPGNLSKGDAQHSCSCPPSLLWTSEMKMTWSTFVPKRLPFSIQPTWLCGSTGQLRRGLQNTLSTLHQYTQGK